jgi:hypothetical protein
MRAAFARLLAATSSRPVCFVAAKRERARKSGRRLLLLLLLLLLSVCLAAAVLWSHHFEDAGRPSSSAADDSPGRPVVTHSSRGESGQRRRRRRRSRFADTRAPVERSLCPRRAHEERSRAAPPVRACPSAVWMGPLARTQSSRCVVAGPDRHGAPPQARPAKLRAAPPFGARVCAKLTRAAATSAPINCARLAARL